MMNMTPLPLPLPVQRAKNFNVIQSLFMKRLGFTLVELLVVISIISLLSSISLSSLQNARASGRDALRVQQLKQIQQALELYSLNNDGEYLHNNSDPGYVAGVNTVQSFISTLQPLVDEGLLAKIPQDPLGDGNQNCGSNRCRYGYYEDWPSSNYAASPSSRTCNDLPYNRYEYVLTYSTEVDVIDINSHSIWNKCLPGPLK